MIHLQNGIYDLTHPPARNIVNLDILRSLAILLVFSGHFGAEFHASPALQKLPPLYFGWTGVDLFFVLSGYLIGKKFRRPVR
jgi:peptidoglycan/LPS O-acetylase OafA/YrhL